MTSSSFNPIQPIVAFCIETSHLFCNANQMIGFYILNETLGWNGLGATDSSKEIMQFKPFFLSFPILVITFKCSSFSCGMPKSIVLTLRVCFDYVFNDLFRPKMTHKKPQLEIQKRSQQLFFLRLWELFEDTWVPSLRPVTCYVLRWALFSNCSINFKIFVKRVEVLCPNKRGIM